MSLELPKAVHDQVRQAVEKAFPDECCGILAGVLPQGFDRPGRRVTVAEAKPLPNGWETSARERRYKIDEKALMRIEEELAGRGLGIVGFYHSHPDVPAWPSPFDLERAWPCYSYLILCVRGARSDGSRSWMRSEDGQNFTEEEVIIT